MSKETFSLPFRSNWHPHPPHPSWYNRYALLFYSSDGTLNLGHHLDRENRPHIQGRWWAGIVCVCVGWGVCNWFPDSALRGNQIKLTFQAITLLTVFLILSFHSPLSSTASSLPLAPISPANQSKIPLLAYFEKTSLLEDSLTAQQQQGGGTCKLHDWTPWLGIKRSVQTT